MTKSAGNLVTTIALDRTSRSPLHQQLYHEFRNAIVSKRFRAGARLPSTRALAEDLGVSRNTVTNAFDQLIAEGYLEGRVGSGTYVSDVLPDELLWLRAVRENEDRRPRGGRMLSARGRKMAGIAPFFPPVKPAPFRHGLPALDEFPLRLWNQLLGKRLRKLPRELLGYGDPAGYWPLREAIASYLGTARAVRCTPEQVIVVAGSQQAIYLTALVLLDAGDFAWIEDPGYLGARGALQAAEARLVPVPVDQQGLSAAVGVALNKNARLVYVTPSNQYPSTVTMSLSRRLELLEWAHRAGAWIIEDDYDSEFRFKSRPIAALQGLDNYGRVIYLGTFSKLLAPSLRLGYLVVPAELIDAFSAASALMTRHPPSALQVVLSDFINQGHLARHIRRMRTIYMERQSTLIEAASRELGGLVEITPPEAGTHVIGWLPPDIDDRLAVTKAAQEGVEARAFSTYCMEAKGRSGLVLGYGAFTKKQIRAGMQKLASALGRRAKGPGNATRSARI